MRREASEDLLLRKMKSGVTERNPGTTGTCQAVVLWQGKKSHCRENGVTIARMLTWVLTHACTHCIHALWSHAYITTWPTAQAHAYVFAGNSHYCPRCYKRMATRYLFGGCDFSAWPDTGRLKIGMTLSLTLCYCFLVSQIQYEPGSWDSALESLNQPILNKHLHF